MATLAPPRPSTRRGATVGAAVVAGFTVWGLLVGLQPLGDNSFLTHLATGRLILDHGFPRRDPYSFTAVGEPWMVQSWLTAVAYGLLDRIGGAGALVALHASFTAGLAFLATRLVRPAASLLTQVLVLGLALAVGSGMWVQRPLLVGLVVLGVTLLAADGRVDRRWLLPLFWIWTNSHGSFPLGLVALAVLAAGRRLDGERPSTELGALRWAVGGVLLAAVNPLGPGLLVFPIHLLGRGAVLSHVLEWKAPGFVAPVERVFLLQLVLFVVAVVRRPSWRRALPGLLFGVLALTALRNISMASLVMLPAMAHGLDGLGTVAVARRVRMAAPAVVALVVVAVLAVVGVAGRPGFEWADYPVAQVTALERDGVFDADSDERVVTEDFVGNYLTYRLGPTGKVFFDDRFDMYPEVVAEDYFVLLDGGPSWEHILDRRGATVVLWERERPLASLVAQSPRWRVVSDDGEWLVAERR